MLPLMCYIVHHLSEDFRSAIYYISGQSTLAGDTNNYFPFGLAERTRYRMVKHQNAQNKILHLIEQATQSLLVIKISSSPLKNGHYTDVIGLSHKETRSRKPFLHKHLLPSKAHIRVYQPRMVFKQAIFELRGVAEAVKKSHCSKQ